jgi:Arc/MetJ-type ribon-helix-helix transcriptional regulator
VLHQEFFLMPTVTVRLDEETDARLKRRLARSGETLSEFIREAVAKHLDAKPRVETRLASLDRILEQIDDPGDTDLSTTYKARIKEKLLAKHRR